MRTILNVFIGGLLLAAGPVFADATTQKSGAADLVLIGDSTLAPRPGENYYPPSGSWGDALTNHFAAGSVCRNYAVGGRTVVTTLPGWEKSLAGMHAGDFVIVQFGINDAAKKKFVDEAKFKETLGKFVDDIRARGAIPVLCGPISDAGFRKDAKPGTPFAMSSSRGAYRDYTKAVAEAKKVDFVDMTALTAAENSRLGKDGAHALYRGTWDRPDEKTGEKRPVFDTTHPNKAGARRFAELFLADVRSRNLPIAALFRRLPPPTITPANLRADEAPATVESSVRTAAANGLYKFVETTFVFTNPNARPLSADFEFPIPEGATVCGYRLEVNGEMVPGVICEKQKARVAFENEQRKRVDPGIVEHVKGNVWRTRIFPLPANGKRKAEVTYIVAEDEGVDGKVVERCGDYVYEGQATTALLPTLLSPADHCRDFVAGWILWDASLSRKDKTADDLVCLKALPEKGAWKLVVFRDVPAPARAFTSREELIAAVAAEPCDGGTDLVALGAAVPKTGERKLLFSDELDTLNAEGIDLASREDFVCVSRPMPKARRVTVTRRAYVAGETVKEGRLLATAWAADWIADFAAQAEQRKEEFLALGREFGVASPVTSFIVLERLEQWLEHKIEPPKELAIHGEWVKRRAAEDDPIARKKAEAEFNERLLELWEERVRWWKDPKPKRKTPSSGLFARAANAVGLNGARSATFSGSEARTADASAEDMVAMESRAAAPAVRDGARALKAKAGRSSAEKSAAATVTLAAWDPKTPYIDALKSAPKDAAYAEYLKQAEKFGNSPAFYLDCAGFFFKAGETVLAKRIISNLAEFKLEDAALWRTMGWRLREAGAYDEAVRAFRQALRMRREEGQAHRDLALVLAERGQERYAHGHLHAAQVDLTEALKLFHAAAFTNHVRRAARRSNDLQVSIMALEELNGLLAWCANHSWDMPGAKRPLTAPSAPQMDDAFRRDLPMDLRIILSWDADETDIDVHVLEPNGEEAFYGNRRTAEGGFVGEDVTTGYGPEEYLRKDAEKGVYKVLSNYFASHQQALTGAATVTATVYTNWSRRDERRQTLTLRLDKPKDKHLIGEVKID